MFGSLSHCPERKLAPRNSWSVDEMAQFIEAIVNTATAELFRDEQVDGACLDHVGPEVLVAVLKIDKRQARFIKRRFECFL